MAVDFRSGFPHQIGEVRNTIADNYAKYTNIRLQQKAAQEKQNLEDFENDITNLFYNNSLVKGKFVNQNGNYTWDGKETLPTRANARENYKYLADKYDIKMDFAMSQQFDQLYSGMLQGYGNSLKHQLNTLVQSGQLSERDIQEASTNPRLAHIFNTLSSEGNMPEFVQFLPQPTTMDNIIKKVQNLGTVGTTAGVAAIGTGLWAGQKYAPALKDYLFGKKGKLKGTKLPGAVSAFLPTGAEAIAEAIGGEDTLGSAAARTAATAFMAKQLVGEGTAARETAKKVSKKVLKGAAKTGFGSFLKKKLGKSLMKKAGMASILSAADGPLPFGEIASLFITAGWTISEIVSAYNEWSSYINK